MRNKIADSEGKPSGLRWGLASTVSEPDALVLAFVAHWLGLGAARIDLYFDMPAPELVRRLSDNPECQIVVCDAEYWGNIPDDRFRVAPHRQRRNVLQSYIAAEVDWLFHVDADEFLVSERPVVELLAGLDPEVDFVSVPVAERVFDGSPSDDTIFGGVYRRAAKPRNSAEVARIDGANSAFLDRGMAAYPGHKAAFRTGRDLVPAIHGPEDSSGLKRQRLSGAHLLHYDGLTAEHWIWKKRRVLAQQPRLSGLHPHLQAQLKALADAASEDEAVKLYERIKCLDSDRLAALDTLGLILRHDLDPRQAAWDRFGRRDLDFRPNALDLAGIGFNRFHYGVGWQGLLQRKLARVARKLGLKP